MIEFQGPTGYGLEVWTFFKRYYLRCPQAFRWRVDLFLWRLCYGYGRIYLGLEISWPVVVILDLDWDKLEPELSKELTSEILPF
jgi:hypothetical protein